MAGPQKPKTGAGSGMRYDDEADPSLAEQYGEAVADVQDTNEGYGLDKQAPKLTGWQADAVPELKPPETLNPDVLEQTHRRSQLTGLAQSFLGRTPVTLYGLKKGRKEGQVEDTPAWKAVRDQAGDEWGAEQLRVSNANKLQGFYNSYAKMVTDAKNENARETASTAKDLMKAQYSNDSMDRYMKWVADPRNPVNLRTQMGVDKHTVDYGAPPGKVIGPDGQPHIGGLKEAAENRKNDAAQLAQDRERRMQGSKDFRETPSEHSITAYAHASLALDGLNEVKRLIQEDPAILKGGGITWNGKKFRVATKNGQRLEMALNRSYEGLVQNQVRRTAASLGAGTYENSLPKSLDNAEVAVRSLMAVGENVPGVIKAGLRRKHPNFDWDAIEQDAKKYIGAGSPADQTPNIGTGPDVKLKSQTPGMTREQALKVLERIK